MFLTWNCNCKIVRACTEAQLDINLYVYALNWYFYCNHLRCSSIKYYAWLALKQFNCKRTYRCSCQLLLSVDYIIMRWSSKCYPYSWLMGPPDHVSWPTQNQQPHAPTSSTSRTTHSTSQTDRPSASGTVGHRITSCRSSFGSRYYARP